MSKIALILFATAFVANGFEYLEKLPERVSLCCM